MRVAIVTESFLPHVNGVTNSVLRILEHLSDNHFQALVIAPGSEKLPTHYAKQPVVGVPVIPTQNFLPTGLPMGLPQKRVQHLISSFAPDVIHLASPFALGSYANKVGKRLGIPTVSVYQTDLGGFAKQYGLGIAQNSLQKILYKIHSQTDRTLAPSTAACLDLHLAGVPEVYLWRRGVNSELFNPNKRSESLREIWNGGNKNKIIIGFVGRLAQEKRLIDLLDLQANPNIQLVIVGDGPHRRKLEQVLPRAIFLGFKSGEELAQIYASFDLFIHPGPNETFCQTVQEALASGVPAIVPKTGGPADLVSHLKTGYVIDVDDFEQLNHIVNHYQQRNDCEQMRIAARDSVVMRTWASVNQELAAHYQEVINIKRGINRGEIGVA
jgi:phosphatidylinositol alpha 1,6-mannosyltransferase